MGLLNKETIFAASDIKTETVKVPEWGGEVLVQSLSGKHRDQFEASMAERRGKTIIANTNNIRARLVAWSVVDETGTRLFNDGDIPELGEHSASAIDRIYKVAARMSGLSDEDVEEMVQDFGGTNGRSSSTASPKPSAEQSKKP